MLRGHFGAREPQVVSSCYRKFIDHFSYSGVDQAWANRRSPTVWQSIANIFHSKNFSKLKGVVYVWWELPHLPYSYTQIGTNFPG